MVKAFFQIFVLQGILAVIVSAPTIVIGVNGVAQPITNLVYLGIAIWVVGFFFEVVGDFQLDKFLSDKNNKGKIMKEGLWKYSRHPNYFGDACAWWGIALIAAESRVGLFGIIGALVMNILLLKYSGVPILENHYIKHRT